MKGKVIKMKKFLSFICLAAVILTIPMSVYAYKFPNSVWKPNDAYASALQSGDNYGVINFGCQVMNILKGEPQNQQVIEFLASRCEGVAKAYENLGDYASSAVYYAEYAHYAAALGFDDAVRISNAKAKEYTPRIELAAPAAYSQVNFGARNEPEKGVRYGITVDSTSRESLPNESMTLIYINFGDDSQLAYIRRKLEEAAAKGIAVEIAWNVTGEGNEIASVPYNTGHIDNVLALLKDFPTIPFYVRFAAEVDVWTVKADPAAFKNSFAYIANAVHTYVPNAAVVWSVNMVSGWDVNVDDYYPGDEYVDWVGVSLYLQKYFLGQNDQSENGKINEIMFFSGKSADPITALEKIINTYGNRKPVMVAEGGVSHYINSLGEDASVWSQVYLRKMLNYIPIMYPQVKLIAYFDKVMNETNNYALSANGSLFESYRGITQNPWYIQGNSSSALSFAKMPNVFETGKISTFMTYVHTYGAEEPKVNYFVDGVFYSSRDYAPYTCNIAIDTPGQHTLKVTASSGDNVLCEREYTIWISNEISVAVNDVKILSDVAPVLVNDRTLVPIRLIAENLGAQVMWNEAAQEVTIIKDDDVIKMTIGVNSIDKNGVLSELDVAPTVTDGRTLLPVRAVAEALNCTIDWIDEQNLVSIIK